MSAAGKLFFKTDLTDELHFGVRTKAIGYVPCYKLAAFNGFQFYDKCFRRLAYNGSRLCEAVDFEKQMFNLKLKIKWKTKVQN